MKPSKVIEKAYGSMPREVGFCVNVDIFPFRGIRYYALKVIRFFTR